MPETLHPDHPQEAQHLSDTIHKMTAQIQRWEDRERISGADLETSLVMGDNAQEWAAMLGTHLSQPYFGSLLTRIAGRDQLVYIGKHAFRDHSSPAAPHSVVSWESDVGSLFYSEALEWQTRKKLTGKIRRRRQLDVVQRDLKAVTDLYDDALGGDTGGREKVLLKRLAEGSTTGMRDVVETLQPEQNEAMRFTAGRPIIVQGAAGSGKTTIGFHRLAWLTHADRARHQARPEACLVLMPNRVLAAYAARVLPGLNLQGVTVTTPETWALSFLNLEKMEIIDRTLQLLMVDTNNERRKAAWLRSLLLGQTVMLEVVRAHLKAKILHNIRGLSYQSAVDVPVGATGRVSRSVSLSHSFLHAQVEAVLGRSPLEGYRAALRQLLEEEILAQSRADEESQATVLRQVARELTELVAKVFSNLLPVSEARKLLSDEATLRQAAGTLLDERTLRIILSDPLSAIPKPRRSAADVTEIPIMLAIAALIDGLGRKVGRELEPYDHLILDEGQDYAPLLYLLLARAARPGHITVLGDGAQGLHGYKGPRNWQEVSAALSNTAELIELGRTYRSTRQITEVAAHIAATYSKVGQVIGVDRDGLSVQRLTNGLLPQQIAQAVKDMQAQGLENIAIVTRRTADAEKLAERLQHHDVYARSILNEQARYEGGVITLPVNLAKGLEFDGCIVAGADASHYDPATEFETRLLYVAVSRGLHALALTAEGELHPLLQG